MIVAERVKGSGGGPKGLFPTGGGRGDIASLLVKPAVIRWAYLRCWLKLGIYRTQRESLRPYVAAGFLGRSRTRYERDLAIV